MKSLLHAIWADDTGQDIAEYALMLTAILMIVVATVSAIGTNAESTFSTVAGKLTNS